MKLPQRLTTLLARDTSLYAATLQAITVIEPWARDNKTVFFPEYTDHSLVHMGEVLAAADSLISDEAWTVLTPQDAAITTLAVLLHDCALHLSEDGFFSLISGAFSSRRSKYIESEGDWKELWQRFLAESRRFSEQKLVQLFGAAIPITTFPSEKLQLTRQHNLLVGEFLRRHHARLAHEIALSGIPGPTNTVALAAEANRDLLDLAGYVARSHNLGLRVAVDAIEPAKRRIHLGCHVPFVMALLRLSDYLQIQATRAPGQLLQLKSLNSPISREEWDKHASVQEMHQAHDDPESIFVDCLPTSARTFISMRKLLADIQRELDQSWAVIGEIYGRVSPLDKLTITVRRIRSNIDDADEFERTRQPPYIPHEFRFRTASAELMDLLVAPLYGEDKPGIGIRELVQNAVDACLERDDLIRRGLAQQTHQNHDDVLVTLYATEDDPRVVVEDYGVGMTPDVVDKYFLNVGASFRSSDLWRQIHETAGHATIHRTGRFGIGVLAAFLLGTKISVKTRHINSKANAGLAFECARGDGVVEIRPCTFHHGTRIEIAVHAETVKELLTWNGYRVDWDWYCLEKPSVVRKLIYKDGHKTLAQRYKVPACGSNIDSTQWHRISVDGYDDVLWGFNVLATSGYYTQKIIVNGIYVSHSSLNLDISNPLDALRAKSPTLIVYDPDGRFPINLQRDRIVGSLGLLGERLAEDISAFFCGEIVQAFNNVTAGISDVTVNLSTDPGIAGFRDNRGATTELGAFLISSNGILPVDFDLMREVKPGSIVLDATNVSASRGAYKLDYLRQLPINYIPVDTVSTTKISRSTFLRNSIEDDASSSRKVGSIASLPISGRRVLARKADIAELVPSQIPRYIWGRMNLELDLGAWGVWSLGTVPSPAFDLQRVAEELEPTGGFGLVVLYLDWTKTADADSSTPSRSAFYRAWMQTIGTPVLPLKSK